MKGIDKSGGVWYSNTMNRQKSITLPVPPGATVAWVKAQKAEMVKRLLEEMEPDKPYKVNYQWTKKDGFSWMVVVLEEVGHAKTTT